MDKEEAINQDAPFKTARLDKLNAIAKQNESEVEYEDYDKETLESRYEGLEEILAGSDNDEESQEAVAEAPQETPKEQPAPPVYLKDGEWYTKEKVNGVEREVPFNEIRARAQKISAADQYLAQAAQKRKELEEQERLLAQRAQQLQQLPSQGATEEIRELIREHREALLDGDDERADELHIKIIQAKATPAPSIDLNQIAAQVDQRIAEANRQQQLRDAYDKFRRDHQDVIEDPDLYRLVDAETEVLSYQPETQGLPPGEILDRAAKAVKERLAKRFGQPTLSSEPERQARKKPGMSVTGVSARQPKQPEVGPRTLGDKLNEMRMARGQAPLG